MKAWCTVHGDVTACSCRPAPKKFFVALVMNWWKPDFLREVSWRGPRPVIRDRPAKEGYKDAGQRGVIRQKRGV